MGARMPDVDAITDSPREPWRKTNWRTDSWWNHAHGWHLPPSDRLVALHGAT